ncbi:HAD family hydrolase [Rossellomorea arthrocnemi]|uniref:HAD family hydrolase n=1 Tax=Rossellomorea arthrocnemi TaxID=2769542 RepID=UPI001917F4B9|nr:HAD family hydrolase [Rossellomorea arthrocnemi]
MNAFASDLDRTLIFSPRMLEAYGSDANEECIELLDGKPISYISLKTKEVLKQIHENMFFIPVTTRTIEQYKRIQLFQEDIVPEYAITSNGGTILKRGTVLKEWTRLVQGLLRNSTPLEDVMKKVAALDDTKWIKKIKPGDSVFFYIILHTDRFSPDVFMELRMLSDHLGWQVSLQGRKLYFIPKILTKWTALHYLGDELGLKNICTAGDSILDLELITNGTLGMAPLHGEVLEKFPTLNMTGKAGIQASEEIVEIVYSRYRDVGAQ